MKKVKAVVVLDEAVDDLEDGKAFYESIEEGIGDYFIDCLLSDINSLRIHAGTHPTRLLQNALTPVPFRHLLGRG